MPRYHLKTGFQSEQPENLAIELTDGREMGRGRQGALQIRNIVRDHALPFITDAKDGGASA
jgi:hypothetical protein